MTKEMIVEDEFIMSKQTQTILESLEYEEIAIVSTTEEAIKKVEEHS